MKETNTRMWNRVSVYSNDADFEDLKKLARTLGARVWPSNR